MRSAPLLLFLSALLSGCSLFGDCQSVTPNLSQRVADLRLDTDAVPLTDTLTVAIVVDAAFELILDEPTALEPHDAAGLGIDADVFGDPLPGPLRTVVRNDTVFVGTERAFQPIRLACAVSYAGARLDVVRAQAPAGVRALRWIYADPGSVPELPETASIPV